MGDGDEKVAIVTGANRGLGKATAARLAELGATVLLVCRDAAKGKAAVEEIRAANPAARLELHAADLSDLGSVRGLAGRIAAEHPRLDILVNNASTFTRERRVTRDRYELMLATNHLGPFLLTNLLLPPLAAGRARALTVTAPSTTKLDFDDLQGERRFRPLWAFGATKSANLLFTYALARRLEGRGTANAFHPGLVRTDLMREAPALIRGIARLAAKPPERAAHALAEVATSPRFATVTGAFLKGTERSESSPYSRDAAVQDRLWAVSARLAGLPT